MQVRVKNLNKSYRDADRELTVIQNVSFAFPPKGSVAIIGRSGIGKSTLMHLLGALDTPSSGEILYDDVVVSALGSDERAAFRARNVGFIFQFHHLLPEFSAIENVSMPLTIAGVSDQEARDMAAALLDRMGLKHRYGHLPSQLSGGAQQRVAIARALDEPTGNLDAQNAEKIGQLLMEVPKEQNTILIVVTHSLELARSMSKCTELRHGKLVDVSDASK